MKTKHLLALTLMFFVMSTDAQSRWGLRTGLNFDMAGIGLDELRAFLESREGWKPNVMGQCMSWLNAA